MAKALKTSYSLHHQVESFFTGTQLIFDQTGDHFYCAYGSVINKVSVEDGQIKARITTKNESDLVIRFTVTSDDRLMIIAYSSGLITKFNLINETVEREFKSIHTAPISYLKTNASNTLLATASSDGSIKLWNLVNHYCSHNLKGINGVVSCVEFHDTPEGELLFCSAGDDNVHIFDLESSKRLIKLSTHCSTITDLKVCKDGKRLLSVGRDKIAVLWNIDKDSGKNFGRSLRTIPIFESVESVIILDAKYMSEILNDDMDEDRIFFATIGEEGLIKFWDAETGSKVATQNDPNLSSYRSPGIACLNMSLRPKYNQLCAVSSERNIFFYDLPRLNLVQQLQGHLDEILSACWFAKNEYVAIACNSNDLKIMEVSSSRTHHLKGHQDIILCVKSVPSDPYCLVTSSKDCTTLVWKFDPATMVANVIYKGTGHTHAVYALGVVNESKIFFSAGEDTTIKKWNFDYKKKIAEEGEDTIETRPLVAVQTIKAHDNRIDDIAISPNDQLFATASRDKTAKVFTVEGMQIVGTLKGHRRGVYAVQFSPVDKVIVTAADMNLRMWNLQDFTCIKTLQGHDCSVLNFSFLSSGLQIVSVGSDGNMKLWDCKTSECTRTIDAHDGNTWALALTSDDDKLLTGGQDERLVIWRDTTEEEYEERLTRLQNQVTQEQDFMNYINKKKWRKALRMAIAMENSNKTLSVIREILLEPNGVESLEEILSKTSLDQINFIIDCCIGWLATAKNSSTGQQVLYILFNLLPNEELMRLPSFSSSLDQMKILTEKSFDRYERLVQQATFVDFFLNSFRIQ